MGRDRSGAGYGQFDAARLVTVFMVVYAFGQVPFGKIFDMIGTRLGFVLKPRKLLMFK